ncbi:MAG: hypothetical protein ACLRNW_08075 [Neglectibacter sp.]
MSKNIVVSALGKTWILDIDGTVCKHNGYKLDGHDTLLPGAKQFFEVIEEIDKVVFITSRSQAYAEMTESFLRENGIRWNAIIYDLPYGERILVNDKKPSGLKTSIAVNTERDVFMEEIFIVDESL